MALTYGDRERDSDDRVLLQRLRSGDRAALDEIVGAYWSPLVGYVQAFVNAVDPAEDVAQETFLRLWQGRRRWDGGGAVKALIYRIARNLAIDYQRRTRVRRAWRTTGVQSQARHSPGPDEDVEEAELRKAVERAIDGLPARRREVFKLVRFHDFSYREVAELLELSEQTVANHMSSALADLRRALRPFLPDQPTVQPRSGSD